MTSNPCSSVTLLIDNFQSISSESSVIEFENDPNKFSFYLTRKHSLPYFNDCTVVYLRRGMPYDDDIQVVGSISVLNKNGDKCCTEVSQTYFTKCVNEPATGGLFYIRNNYLFDLANGLLVDGKLTLHYEVEILNIKEATGLKINLFDEGKKIVSLAHQKTLQNYQSLLDTSKYSDVVFVIGTKEFKLHKNILASQSPVFSAMFDSDLEEAKQNRVDIIDVDVEVFEAMIRFIYTGNVDSVQQNALELFVAADKYQLDSLKEICAQSLGTNLSIESVANILLVADMHSAQQLKSKCVKYINTNVSEVMATDGWKQLMKDKKPFELIYELYQDLAHKS